MVVVDAVDPAVDLAAEAASLPLRTVAAMLPALDSGAATGAEAGAPVPAMHPTRWQHVWMPSLGGDIFF